MLVLPSFGYNNKLKKEMAAAETVREWQENVMMRRQTTTIHLNYEKIIRRNYYITLISASTAGRTSEKRVFV